MIKKVSYGSEAISYIKGELGNGGVYAKRLLRLPLDGGKVYSYLPVSVDPASIRNFAWSTYLDHGVKMLHEVYPKIVSQITSFLSNQENRYAIFSTYASVGDGFLDKDKTLARYVSYNSNVYFCISSKNHSKENIMYALKFAAGWPRIHGLTSLPSNVQPLQSRQALTKKQMNYLADRTDYIIIGAYDGEGYLVWGRDKTD